MVRKDTGRRSSAALVVPAGVRFALVVAAALAVKAIVLAQLNAHPLLQPHGELDTAYYVALARQVAAGGPLAVREAFAVSPLYVFFLAAVFALTDGALVAAKIAQIVLGALAVGLLYLTARGWFSERSALATATLAILTGIFTFYEVVILQAALDPFLVALSLFLVSKTAHSYCDEGAPGGWTARRAVLHLATGAALGLLSLNRPNALLYAAIVPLLILVRFWRSPGAPGGVPRRAAWAALRPAIWAGAGILLILAPNAARNLAVSGEMVWISSHGGLNLFIGNNPAADGTYHPVPGIRASIEGQAVDATRVAEAAEGRRLSAAEVSRYFSGQAWNWMKAHPADAARLFLRKALLVLNRTDAALNYSYAFYSADEHTLLRALPLGAWLLVPLGLAGLLVASLRRARRGFWLPGSFVPIYALSLAAFFVSDRYRLPLLVAFCVTGGAAAGEVYDRLRQRQLRPLLVPAIVAIVAVAVSYARLGVDDGRANERTRKAIMLVDTGAVDEARRYAARVSHDDPHPGLLHLRVGQALVGAGHFEDAVGELQAALAADGGQPLTHLELGRALLGADRAQAAVGHLQLAVTAGYRIEASGPLAVRALALTGRSREAIGLLELLPDQVAATQPALALDLGDQALALDARNQAVRWLRMAASGDPGNAEAHEKLGEAMLLVNRPEEAVASLETACRLQPSNADAHLNLAVAYAEAQRFDLARAHAEESMRLDPSEPRTRALLAALPRRSSQHPLVRGERIPRPGRGR